MSTDPNQPQGQEPNAAPAQPQQVQGSEDMSNQVNALVAQAQQLAATAQALADQFQQQGTQQAQAPNQGQDPGQQPVGSDAAQGGQQ